MLSPARLAAVFVGACLVFILYWTRGDLAFESGRLPRPPPCGPCICSGTASDAERHQQLLSTQLMRVYFDLDSNDRIKFPAHITGVALDIGAHDGGEAVKFAKMEKSLFVIAFEPLVGLRSTILKITEPYSNIRAVMAAVGPESSITKFFVANYPMASGLLPFNTTEAAKWLIDVNHDKASFNVKAELVVQLNVNHLIEAIPSHLPIKYYWSDAQGFDFGILKSIKQENLRRIERGRLEVNERPLYVGQAEPSSIKQYLVNAGFLEVHDLNTGVKGMFTDLEFRRS